MGSFLDKPKTEKTNESGQGNDLRYGLGAMQGWRIEMEDSHCSVIGLPRSGFEAWSFFAVFDGHAGGTVSKFSAKELLECILDADPDLFNELSTIYSNNLTNANNQSSPSLSSSSSSNLNKNSPRSNDQATTTTTSTNNSPIKSNSDLATKANNLNTNSNTNLKNVAEDSSSSSNKSLSCNSSSNLSNVIKSTTTTTTPSKYSQIYEERLKEAIRKGFLNLDDKIRRMPEFEKGEDKSGSTAVACLISPSHVYLINCGDSRSIFVSDERVVLSTLDHKPINPCERERIQNAGGSVMIQRVNGSLAVSRALGDYEYKQVENRGPCEQLVSPEPEVYSRERQHSKDEFIVLACDGIWDVMSNDELKDYIYGRLKVTDDLVKISNDILDMCLSKGSRDNMSLIIVLFPAAPKVTQEEVEKDKNCNEKIENRIKELIESTNSKIELSHVISMISEENWEDLPRGGGVHAKQALIEEIFSRLLPKNNENDSINTGSYIINSTL